MAADDYSSNPQDQGFPTDLDGSSSMSGNRPASGARRATPGEVLSQGFQGDQNAGDFLGLDTEFAGQDTGQGYAGGAPLDLVPPPGTYSEEQYAAATAPAPLPASDPVQEFAQAPSAFEFGGDLGSEEGDLALGAESPAPSRKPLVVAVLLVAALAAGGVFYGPTLYTRYFGAETKVADDAGKGWEQKPTRPKETPTEPAKPSADPATVAQVEPGAKVPETKPSASVPPAATPPEAKPSSLPARPVAVVSEDQPSASKGAGAPAGKGDPAPAVVAARPQPMPFPNLDGSEYAWASEDQLELIWRGSEVPLEAMSAPAKTLMPRVGNVRVFTTAGDVLEGRLYAVGQNRVWIDGAPGRIGLDGSKVERIEVLPPQPEGQARPSEDLQLTGAKRVRVRVPGGMLYGRVLKASGDDVTLALDDGGRVRVKAGDVQELGTGRAVVVNR